MEEDPEDLDRLPDGIPHAVIGLTAFYSVSLAIALVLLLTQQHVSLVALVALALPLLVWRLTGKAERERDHLHPSR
jgi:hypothetical protein